MKTTEKVFLLVLVEPYVLFCPLSTGTVPIISSPIYCALPPSFPEALQSWSRVCNLVLGMEAQVPGLRDSRVTASSDTLQGKGMETEAERKLRFRDQKYKLLCLTFSGEKCQCVAPDASSGVLSFKQSFCFILDRTYFRTEEKYV